MTDHMEKVFSNHVILSKVFSFLDLKSLKDVRKVNKFWSASASRSMSNFIVTLEPPTPENIKESREFQEFMRRKKISQSFVDSCHTLNWKLFYNLLVLDKLVVIDELSELKKGVEFAWNNKSMLLRFLIVPIGPSTLPSIRWFLAHYKNPHVLTLSFLKYSWFPTRPEVHDFALTLLSRKTFWRQKTNFKIAPQIESYLANTAPFIVELRLEMKLKTQEEANLLSRILNNKLISMKKLALDVADFDDEVLKAIPLFILPKATETLGFRVATGDINGKKYAGHLRSMSVSALEHLIKSFTSIQYLDFESWKKYVVRRFAEHGKIKNTLEAITNICEDDTNAFLNLKGIKATLLNPYSDILTLKLFPINLSSLSLSFEHFRSWKSYPAFKFEDVAPIIESHAESLEHLDMFWYVYRYNADPKNPPNIKEINLHFPMDLPHLPKLKTFSYISVDHEPETAQFFDPFHSILLKGSLELDRILPSLKTIGVLLPHLKPKHEKVWENIFPEKTETGEILEFCGIENLVVSLNAECDSPQIARLYSIFPNLKILRHTRVRTKKEGLGCCEHKKKRDQSWEHFFREESLVINQEVEENWGYSGKFQHQMGKPNLTIMSQFFND